MATIGGYDLGHVQNEGLEADSGIIILPNVADGESDHTDTEGFQMFAPTRRFKLEGVYVDSVASIRTAYGNILGLMKNQESGLTYASDFLGSSTTVKILALKANYIAGQPAELSFSLDMVEVNE